MAGHSHFKSIKHKKELLDKKRGQIFSKLVKEISLAAKNDPRPETNPKLRLAIEKAKKYNMPWENIERAIKRGSGEIKGESLEELLIEIIGPGKTAIIVEAITDNKNRTLSEIKQIVNKHNAKLVDSGSLKWMFDKRGVITINLQETKLNKEELELKVIEAGAEDIFWDNNILNVYTKIENLSKVKENIENLGLKIDEVSLDWVPKELIEIDEETKRACENLFEALDENEAVQDIYFNYK
jgi:YebC/PmpR family DNA-binding regulatory protein